MPGVTRAGRWWRRMVMKVDVAQLYELHVPDLMRFATVLVGPADAGDVVSDAMVGLMSRPASSSVRDPRAYLFRSVSNVAASHHRSRTRRRERELRSVSNTPPPSGGEPTASVDARRVLSVLSEQQRAVIFLAYWRDLAPGEIAELLGVTEGTVRKQLARARDRLREEFDRDRHTR